MTVRVAVLIAALAIAAISSREDQWQPLSLVLVLAALCILSDLLALHLRSVLISGSFIALVLAMALLGPAPAAAIGVVSVVVDTFRRRATADSFLVNAATYALFPLAGGMLIGGVRAAAGLHRTELTFLLLVFAAFFAANLLNFLLIAVWSDGPDRIPAAHRLRTDFLPLLPSELAAALLTVGIVGLYAHVGLSALALAAVVLVVFQYLCRELLLSQERAQELERRTTQLGSLHVGILTTMLQTLSLRDRSTARHSAAVARFARELAAAIGCSEAERELVHTAGLLHDIGKFILPDAVLFAGGPLSDEHWRLIRLHPVQGAELVGRVDGYGPVADIIISHHERPDGTGYPHALRGDAIPLLARIIAIADTYDVMTARDSYRTPVSSENAVAELRRQAGRQFEGWLVEAFARVLQERGVAFRHADDADFEAELAFERRVAAFLEPRRAFQAAARRRPRRRVAVR